MTSEEISELYRRALSGDKVAMGKMREAMHASIRGSDVSILAIALYGLVLLGVGFLLGWILV